MWGSASSRIKDCLLDPKTRLHQPTIRVGVLRLLNATALVRPGTSVEGTATNLGMGLAGLNQGEGFCCNAVILHRKNILGLLSYYTLSSGSAGKPYTLSN